MPRYIDADVYKQEMQKWDDCRYEMVLDSMPTADVVPVVHAEWKWVNGAGWRCSKCKLLSTAQMDGELFSAFTPGFCPNCGAHMKGRQ